MLETRISHLAYAQEIAGAMLRRQQATAVVAARRQIEYLLQNALLENGPVKSKATKPETRKKA